MSDETGRTEPTTPLETDPTNDLDELGEMDAGHAEPPAGRHPVIVSQLVMGLVFLGLALIWALHAAGVVDTGADWVLPLLLVVAGGAGLVATVARGTSR